MRSVEHKSSRLWRSFTAFSGRFAVISVVCAGLLTAGGYAYMVPRLGGELASAGALPVPSPASSKEAALSPLPLDLDAKRQAPAEADGSLEIAEVTGQDDTLYSLLSADVNDEPTVVAICRTIGPVIEESLGKPFDGDSPLQPGLRYGITLDRDGRFLKATVELDPAQVFHVVREPSGLRAWKEDVVLDFKRETISLTMAGNLTESVLKAGEGMELALKLTNVFRWDIDFPSEAIAGDVCRMVFERRYADDRPSGYGRILYALYEGKKTGKKTAILFNETYYDGNGVELKKNFLRSPLNVLRVTSKRGMRLHPILGVWRKHDGVDFGAPTGTPVWSVAAGTVIFSGWRGGLGNCVCIRHDTGHESRYGHLSRIFVRQGQRVKQLHRIGLVGQTGQATGPHLDFQLLLGRKHLDPLKVKMVKSPRSVPAPLKDRFSHVAQQYRQYLTTAHGPQPPRDPALARLP